MKKILLVALALLLIIGATGYYFFQLRLLAWQIGFPQPRYSLEVDKDVKVAMSDGTKLATDIYRPRGKGKFPVIIARTPYSKTSSSHHYSMLAELFASQGYVFIMQDVRGKYRSEGIYIPYKNEGSDGHDTIEWAGKAEWSDGKVAMCGFSYLGACAWLPATYESPYLKTIIPLFACQSIYAAWMDQGVPYLKDMLIWLAKHSGKEQKNISFEEADAVLTHFPVESLDTRFTGHELPIYQEYLKHLTPDAYWESFASAEKLKTLNLPILFFAGWYDRFLPCTITEYTKMSQHAPVKLIIGPWVHVPIKKPEDISFGKQADFFIQLTTILNWCNYWLHGEGSVDLTHTVNYFETGSNVWKEAKKWPPSPSTEKVFYLAPHGGLTDAKVEKSHAQHYAYNPRDPVPSIGSTMIYGNGMEGPREQSAVASRKDVVVFRSHAMVEDLEIAGPVKLVLYVSSSAVDTDFCAKISDMHPDGKSYFLQSGFLRMRYRDGMEAEKLMEPGKKYRIEIEMGSLGHAFLKGHRLQLQVTSSDFPNHSRHTNTAETPERDSEHIVVAHQTIFFGGNDDAHLEMQRL